ncbi:hypothetical protein RND81_12G027500 [Saponaria officinalis]|uniref:Myb-like domain-containing protein n=1 Tax=Saponaria officinalis TaxID=3572 RepID=A0AAW1H4F5_SAPOF
MTMLNPTGLYDMTGFVNPAIVSPRVRPPSTSNTSMGTTTPCIPISNSPPLNPIDLSQNGLDDIVIDEQQNDEGNKKERVTWSMKEDIVLSKAWVTISDNPKIGKNQKDGQFWKRIVEYYHEHNEIGSERSVYQAKGRCHRCIGDVNEFNEIFNRIHNEYHSG